MAKETSQNTQHHQGTGHESRHMLMMMLMCLLPIIVILAGKYIFGWNSNQWLILAVLAVCGIGHLLMMKGQGGHKH